MASYIYRCGACERPDMEVSHSMKEDPEVVCGCGQPRRRVPAAPGFILKGNGWYSKQDYRTEQ
jgi:putative FmdB family regulatory protein